MPEQMPEQLFRRVALDRLASPERLDELMVVNPPHSWLALLGLWAVLLAGLTWGIYGSIPSLLHAQGMLTGGGSAQTVDAPATGDLRELLVNAGDDIRRDQIVARIVQAADNQVAIVTSPHAGRVRAVRAQRGSPVHAGAPLLTVEQPGGQLEAILYVPAIDAWTIQPGMEVLLSPAPVKKEEHGRLLGRVAAVGAVPVSQTSARRVFDGGEPPWLAAGPGRVVEVRVQLVRNPATASGYEWTSTVSTFGSLDSARLPGPLAAFVPARMSPAGPSIALASGTPCTADIITEQRAPASLVLAGVGW